MISDKDVARINELARLARSRALTAAEESERALLRQEYVRSVRESLRGQLEHTSVLYPDGHQEKLRKKD